jgi:hypothetical protein
VVRLSSSWAIVCVSARSRWSDVDRRVHIAAAVFAWAMLIYEFVLDLERGVPAI